MTEKELETTIKFLKAARDGVEYWFCKEDNEGQPMLFVDKSASAVKSLVKDALAKKRVKSSDRVSGTVRETNDGLVFEVASDGDKEIVEKGLVKLALDESSLKKFLSSATVAVAGKGETENTGEELPAKLTGLKLTVDSWKTASKVTLRKRSSTLVAIDDALAVWENSPGSTLVEQLSTIVALKKANDAWRADKMGESIRMEASTALGTLIDAQVANLKKLCLAERDVQELLKTPALEDHAEETNRFHQQMNDLSDYRSQNSPQAAAAKDHVTRLQALVYSRLDKVSKENDEKKDKQDLSAIEQMKILSNGTLEMIRGMREGNKVSEADLIQKMFDDFFAYGKQHFTYSTSASGGTDLLGGSTKGACGTFANSFARMVNLVLAKKTAAKAQKISAKNFYTLPLQQLGFIDAKCPGNLCMEEGQSPSAYFFTEHWITIAGGKAYDPTTGRSGGDVNSSIVESGFTADGQGGYVKGNKTISVELGAGYGGGSRYTLKST